jgi:hypothetical protein
MSREFDDLFAEPEFARAMKRIAGELVTEYFVEPPDALDTTAWAIGQPEILRDLHALWQTRPEAPPWEQITAMIRDHVFDYLDHIPPRLRYEDGRLMGLLVKRRRPSESR